MGSCQDECRRLREAVEQQNALLAEMVGALDDLSGAVAFMVRTERRGGFKPATKRPYDRVKHGDGYDGNGEDDE